MSVSFLLCLPLLVLAQQWGNGGYGGRNMGKGKRSGMPASSGFDYGYDAPQGGYQGGGYQGGGYQGGGYQGGGYQGGYPPPQQGYPPQQQVWTAPQPGQQGSLPLPGQVPLPGHLPPPMGQAPVQPGVQDALAKINNMPSAPVYSSLPPDFPVGPIPDTFPHFMVDLLTDDNFFNVIADSKADYYIVEFYLHTCPHCQHFALSVERLAMTLQNTHVRVGSIDCLVYPNVCALYNPPVVPTVMIASLPAWASKQADPAWREKAWADIYNDDLDKRIDKVDSARRRVLEKGVALNEQELADEARALFSISPWPSPQSHPYPIILDRDPGLGGIHATMAAINAKVGFEPSMQLISMTDFQIRWNEFLKTEPNKEGLHDSAVVYPRVDNWDIETGAAQAIQFAFLREDINATVRLSLINFLKTMCKAYPDVSPEGTCRASLCELATRTETKWTQLDPDFPDRSGVPPWSVLKDKWKLCGRPWEDYTAGFAQCKGSYNRRGHSCALWSMFHSLVRTDAGSDGTLNEKRDYLDRLHAIREYVKWFFNCDECADHFVLITQDYGEIKSKLEAMLYLWRKHNMVNARVFKLEMEHGDFDPAFPKLTFPSHAQCPKCYLKEGAVSKDITIARSASCAKACGKAGDKCHCDTQCESDLDCCHDYYTQCKKEGNPFKTAIEWDEWEVSQFLLEYFEAKPSSATPSVGSVIAKMPQYMLAAFEKLAKLKAQLASGQYPGAGGVPGGTAPGGTQGSDIDYPDRRGKKPGRGKKGIEGGKAAGYDPRRVDETYDPRNPLAQYGNGFGGRNDGADPFGYGGHPETQQLYGQPPMNPMERSAVINGAVGPMNNAAANNFHQVVPHGYQQPITPQNFREQLLAKIFASATAPASAPGEVPPVPISIPGLPPTEDLKQQIIERFLGGGQQQQQPYGKMRGRPKGGKRGFDGGGGGGGGLMDSLRKSLLGGGGGSGNRGRNRGEL